MTDTTRRTFIKGTFAAAASGLLLPGHMVSAAFAQSRGAELEPFPDLLDPSNLDDSFWDRPRKIHLIRHTPEGLEQVNATYFNGDKVINSAYMDICELMRDVRANEVVRMDPVLIEILWSTQAFVRRLGITPAPIEITSGFRSEKTNRALIEAGLPAARQSLHIRAQAADFRLPGLTTEILGRLVQNLQRKYSKGGVGFYLRQTSNGGWIHADTGPERTWRG